MLETPDVKRIDTYVNAWSLPVDPWVGLPSEAKLYRHLVTNQWICHSSAAPIHISWLPTGFPTLLQRQLLKAWTKSCHSHLQNPVRTPPPTTISLNYLCLICVRSFSSWFFCPPFSASCPGPEPHFLPALLGLIPQATHTSLLIPPYSSTCSSGAKVFETAFLPLTSESIILFFNTVFTDNCQYLHGIYFIYI